MKASILNAESGNIGTIASGCRSLGHDAIWTDPLFFRCFSANAIFRRLEAQPDRRLSQRSPLRRPGMIILGHASSADWSTAVRSTRPATDQPDGDAPRHWNIDRRSNIKIAKRPRFHHACVPQGN
jgi:hypothetical protein